MKKAREMHPASRPTATDFFVFGRESSMPPDRRGMLESSLPQDLDEDEAGARTGHALGAHPRLDLLDRVTSAPSKRAGSMLSADLNPRRVLVH